MTRKVVSVDLGGTNIRAALANSDGTLLHAVRKPTNASAGKESIIRRLVETILEAAGDDWDEVTEIGIVAPGPLNPYTGVLIYAPNLDGWHDVPLKQILEEKLERPVRLGNDANLAALAEHQFGVAKGLAHVIYITVSTGVGGGIISHNTLIQGSEGFGAEVGQIIVDPHGERHSSGVKGSIEYLAAGPGLVRKAKERVEAQPDSLILKLAGDISNISGQHIGQAAQSGDELAIELVKETGTLIGVMLVTLMSIFNPQIIVIGGGVSLTGDIFFEAIRAVVKDNLHDAYWKNCPIVPVSLGDDVGLLGGVALLNIPVN